LTARSFKPSLLESAGLPALSDCRALASPHSPMISNSRYTYTRMTMTTTNPFGGGGALSV